MQTAGFQVLVIYSQDGLVMEQALAGGALKDFLAIGRGSTSMTLWVPSKPMIL